jgi:hypothetical protein
MVDWFRRIVMARAAVNRKAAALVVPAPVAQQVASQTNVRKLVIVAKDPATRASDGAILFASVDVPSEVLDLGPTGARVKIVDYDAWARVLYKNTAVYQDDTGLKDPFARRDGESPGQWSARLAESPNFHAQNVYAIVMRTLARFEFALGRRVNWGFRGHQLHAAPHAFADANAFYSQEDAGLFFGYFWGISGRPVFAALSHDIIAHETTHALLDGIRNGFTEAISVDQFAFHEAFADIVALLSVYSLPEVVAQLLDKDVLPKDAGHEIRLIAAKLVSLKTLSKSVLNSVGRQFAAEMPGMGIDKDALRHSVDLKPGTDYLNQSEFQEAHRRGEVLVAAVMRTFLTLWTRRIATLGTFEGKSYNLDRVIEDGAKLADQLLTMVIRAIDYCPPIDVDFSDFLSALLTADTEVVPDDSRFNYRGILRETFASYGISPASEALPSGCWPPFDANKPITYARTNFDSMLRDRDEVFRFLWDNWGSLIWDDDNQPFVDDRGRTSRDRDYTIEVDSVRPSLRTGPDGFFVHESICTYRLSARIFGSEILKMLDVKLAKADIPRRAIDVVGGGVIIFDQYGRIKYHVAHRLRDRERQGRRIATQLAAPPRETSFDRRNRFAAMHTARMDG